MLLKLDYIHSPAHGCITQPPCVAPSGDSARVIAYIALCWDCHIQQQNHSVNYANQHSPGGGTTFPTVFSNCKMISNCFSISPLSFGKSFMKIRSAVPENGCLIVLVKGKKQKETKKQQKNNCKTYTHPPPTGSGRRLRKQKIYLECFWDLPLVLPP